MRTTNNGRTTFISIATIIHLRSILYHIFNMGTIDKTGIIWNILQVRKKPSHSRAFI